MIWRSVKIKEVCDILNGYAFESENYVEQGIRIMRITNVQKGKIIDDDPKFYPTNFQDAISKYMLKEKDLLISLTGNVGRVGLVKKELLPAALNQRVACIRIINEDLVLKEYLFTALNRDIFEKECIQSANGIAQKNMSTEWLKDYEIPLPPLNVQKRIAEILEKAEKAIEKRKEADRLADEYLKSVFVEMFGDPATNPMKWGICSIGKVVKSIEAGWSTDGEQRQRLEDEYAVLKISAVTSGYFKEDEYKVIDKKTSIKKYIYPEKGDLLFSRANTRELVGATCVMEDSFPQLLLPDKLWKIRFLTDKSNVYYMKYILSNKAIRASMSKCSTGTSGSMYNISMDKFKSIEIPLPPIELQNEFAKIVEKAEVIKQKQKQSSLELDTLFKSLMQKAFRGELV